MRAAIQESNASGADAIHVDIPGEGVQTIRPTSPLPVIDDSLTIGGYTQLGASSNTLAKGTNVRNIVELDGTNAGNSSWL